MPCFSGSRHKNPNDAPAPRPARAAAAAAAPGVAAPARIPASSTLTGPAPHTSGPHRHDFMNRLDPTVRSNFGAEYMAEEEEGYGVSEGTRRKGAITTTGTGLGMGSDSEATATAAHGRGRVYSDGRGSVVSGGGRSRSEAEHLDEATTTTEVRYPPGIGGPAPTTTGPHKHDALNKLDPRVDSRGGVATPGR